VPDFNRFFQSYVDAFNRSLGDNVDEEAVTACFTECFLSASPSGVNCGRNGDEFRQVLQKGYAFYKQIGTRSMRLRGLDVTPIDELHHMVAVHYTAEYDKHGQTISIDFDVTYLLQTLTGHSPKIFAFVSGDELALYKERGIINA
jgi:hypothetical protein